ncbi:hypothetical protein [Pseudoalteromonas sp. TB64]|uniref:hypothetical protein n=1 Tax=Pseudoalteromonas sp. TB64 TaxID=1938600 RepID=UPI000407E1FB|nr:hypothetical protein [Pseudoalteromonas sp. TB64]
MKYKLPLFVLLGTLLPFSQNANARLLLGSNMPNTAVFVKSEFNGDSSITSVGVEMMAKQNHSNFGVIFTSAVGAAKVDNKQGEQEEFITWDNGMKLGYFNDFFIYAELGLDLFELAFKNDRGDNTYQIEKSNNDIDGYAGIGMGYHLKPFKIEAFTRVRQIDGYYWEAEEHIYSGVQLSLTF